MSYKMIIHKRVEGLAGERARLPIVFLIACPTVTRLVYVQSRTQPQAILVRGEGEMQGGARFQKGGGAHQEDFGSRWKSDIRALHCNAMLR